MLIHPGIDPVAFSLGPVLVRWYGLMYVFAFFAAWGLARLRAARAPWSRQDWTREGVDDMIVCCMIGVVAGGRIGYALFYDFASFAAHPLELFRIWRGGMSFHGGFIGVTLAMWWWSRKQRRHYLEVMDFVAPCVAQGLFFGRIGNFINGELWGRVTDAPWGMIFPGGGSLPRHPSQLYEAGLEGLVLFAAVWLYSAGGGERGRPRGRVAGLFALLYGLFRFLVEFVREPDVQIGYLAFGWLTMGQALCLPLIGVGLWLLLRPSAPAPVAAGPEAGRKRPARPPRRERH